MLVFGNAAPVVADGQQGVGRLTHDGDFHLSRAAVAQCVVDQVAQQDLEQQGIAPYLRIAVAQHELAVMLNGFAGAHGQYFFGNRPKRHVLHRVRRGGIEPRQRQQLSHQVGGPVAAGKNLVQRALFFRSVDRSKCHLRLRFECSQRRTQFMGRVGGEAALVFEGPHDVGEQAIESRHQGFDFRRQGFDGQRVEPVRCAFGNIARKLTQGRQGVADGNRQQQCQYGQREQHRLEQLFGDFAGHLFALLREVGGAGARRVGQQLDEFLTRFAPRDEGGQQPDTGDRQQGQPDQPGAQGERTLHDGVPAFATT